MIFTHRPTPGRITDPYGPRPAGTTLLPFHFGDDWGWKDTPTDPISAAAPGLVIAYADAGAYGRRMIIQHDDGTQAWYCHTSRDRVHVGEQVTAGQHIADIGGTGNTRGPHLHLEYRVRDTRGILVATRPVYDFTGTAGLDPAPVPPPAALPRKEEIMQLAHIPNAAPDGRGAVYLLFGERFYLEFTGQAAASAFAEQIGAPSAPTSRSFFDAVAKAQGITSKVRIVNLDEPPTNAAADEQGEQPTEA